jgi:hypothetical protein
MDEDFQEISSIITEIQGIKSFLLGQPGIPTPLDNLGKDVNQVTTDNRFNDELWEMLDISTVFLKTSDPDELEPTIALLSQKLERYFLKAEMVSKNRLRFVVDDIWYEVVIEKKVKIYLYSFDEGDESDVTLILNPLQFCALYTMLDKITRGNAALNALENGAYEDKYFNAFCKRIKRIGDLTFPSWPEVYKTNFKKSKDMVHDYYFRPDDFYELQDMLRAKRYGEDGYRSLKNLEIEEFIQIMFENAEKNGESQNVNEQQMYEMMEQFKGEQDIDDELFSDVAKNHTVFEPASLEKFRVENQLKKLAQEIKQLEKKLDKKRKETEAKKPNAYLLLREAILRKDIDDVGRWISKADEKDFERLVNYLEYESDEFFKERGALLLILFQSGTLLNNHESFYLRIMTLILNDANSIVDLTSMDPMVKDSVEKLFEPLLDGLPEMLANATTKDEEVMALAEKINNEIYSVHGETVERMQAESPDDETFFAKIGEFMGPIFIEKMKEHGVWTVPEVEL